MKFKAVIIAGLMLGLSAPAFARDDLIAWQPPESPRRGDRPAPNPPASDRPAQKLIPLEQVRSQIQRAIPGRMLDADPPEPGAARPVYIIRWQADSGQRIDFAVDAQTGAILSRRGG